jgi:WD40 repeat protein/serine/threonine protein kinase
MGVVYLARDEVLGRQVAVKLLSEALFSNPEHVAAFLGEARVLARFSHPCIVTVYFAGDDQGYPYLAMEYVEGRTLRERMDEEPLRVAEIQRLGLGIAQALEEAHRQQLVHGDLKPTNVILDSAGRPHVVDFGLARMAAIARGHSHEADGSPGHHASASTGAEAVLHGRDELTDNNTVLVPRDRSSEAMAKAVFGPDAPAGTWTYLAPEQWQGGIETTVLDMWSFGVMMYELLCGKHPYADCRTASGLRDAVMAPQAVPRIATRRDVPAELAAVVDGCLAKDPEMRLTAADAVRKLDRLVHRSGGDALSQECPFRGLKAFSERHSRFFFGRTEEIESFLESLRVCPVLPVVGASGVGKSSFVQAGVIPRLRELDEWSVIGIRPGKEPFETLARALRKPVATSAARPSSNSEHPQIDPAEAQAASGTLAAELLEQPKRLAVVLAAQAREERARVLLLVDQMEEVETMVADREVRDRFLDAVCGAADDRHAPVRVVFTARDDFLSRLAQNRSMRRVLRNVTVLHLPGAEALMTVMTQPLIAAGYRYDDPTLPSDMVAAVADEASALALLQFTAALLWDQREQESKQLRRNDYEAMGGVQGALATHADASLRQLDVDDIRTVRGLMLRMVTPEGTRRAVEQQEMAESLGPRAEHLLKLLSDARLLSVRQDDNVVHYELSHESLVHTWGRLRRWLDEGREESAFLDELGQAAALWDRRGRRRSETWTGEALAGALRNIDRYGLHLPAVTAAFVDASKKAEQARLRRRRVLLVAAFGLISLVAVVSTVKEREADGLRRTAESQALRARNMTRVALVEKYRDDATTRVALLRDMEGAKDDLPLGWEATLRQALNQPVSRHVLTGHTRAVSAVAFSPDGKQVASASLDGTVRVWPLVAQAQPSTLGKIKKEVFALAYSLDGRHVASAWGDGAVRIWAVQGGGEPRILRGHTGPVQSVAYSPDGKSLASASWDQTVRIWPTTGSSPPRVLAGHTAEVYFVAYSPDGKSLASASWDQTVRIWPVLGDGEPPTLRGHTAAVETVAFSPDGRHVASGSKDGTVWIWLASGGGRPRVLEGHSGSVVSLVYDPDGKYVASASWDGTVRLWPTNGHGQVRVLEGHDGEVWSVALSPDGKYLATASSDRTVRTWRADWQPEPTVLKGHTAEVYSASFSPSGQHIFSGGDDSTVRVWPADGVGKPRVLARTAKGIWSVAFNPDGGYVAGGGVDGVVRIWNVAASGDPVAFRGHSETIYRVAFSPDGSHLASCSGDQTVRIWQTDGAAAPKVFRGHTGEVFSVAFSPDGKRVVSASSDKTVRVWPATGDTEPLVFTGHTEGVNSAAFSPDGTHIVSASWDGTARVWPADGKGAPRALEGPATPMFVYAPDGKSIAAAGLDQTVRVWPVGSGSAPRILAGHAGAIPSVAFSPDSQKLISASWDYTIRIWTDWKPIARDDARVWQATDYCWSVDMYTAQLGLSEAAALRQHDRCLQGVAEHGL